jgi:hypothetical protein
MLFNVDRIVFARRTTSCRSSVEQQHGENGKWKMDDGLAYAEPSIQGKLKFITCAVLQKILARTCGYNPAVFDTHDPCHDIPDALCNPKVGMRNV